MDRFLTLRSPRTRSVILWLLSILAVAPALVAFRIQKKHWINIPIWDEWDTPGLALLRYAQGRLTWADLFSQHNESRKVVPRLIHIAIASMAGWDVRQGMALTFLAACALSGLCLFYLRHGGSKFAARVLFAWFIINLLLFAPSQYENFLCGFTFEILIPFLGLFGCCAVNLSGRSLPGKVACNSLLALLATYTFAHGMLLWAFGIPLPTANDRMQRKGGLLLSYGAYLAIAVLSVGCYFVGYRRPEILPPPASVGQVPQLLEFICAWLGMVLRWPGANVRLVGAVAALLIAAALAGSLFVLWTNRKRWRVYYPWLLLLGFSLCSGAMTAVGRINIGIDSVFNTLFNGFSGLRYNLTSVFAYVGTVGLFSRLYEDRACFRPRVVAYGRTGLAIGCTLLGAAWLAMFADERIRVDQFQANRKRARTAVIWSNVIPDNPEIVLAYPYPDRFGKRVEEMRSAGLLKLQTASDVLGRAIAKSPTGDESAAGALVLCVRRGPYYYRFAGWARNPINNSVASYVVLGSEEANQSFHPITALTAGLIREDIAQKYGPAARKAGFDQELDVSPLPPHPITIKAWAIDWDAQQAFPMQGTHRIDLPEP
jgi:hypothetical protein